MKPSKTRLCLITVAVVALTGLSGCESGDYSGSTSVHGSFYYGVGYSSSFYGGPWYGPPPVVVAPPPYHPGRPGGGGGGPRPTPMPAPMPRARAR